MITGTIQSSQNGLRRLLSPRAPVVTPSIGALDAGREPCLTETLRRGDASGVPALCTRSYGPLGLASELASHDGALRGQCLGHLLD